MIPRFPYVNFPSSFYSYPKRPRINPAHPNIPISNFYNITDCSNNSYTKTYDSNDNYKCGYDKNYNSLPQDITDKKNKSNNNNFDYLFDLFGLKIYSDDILLVSLIYFLYSEDVKDEGLFIVLILLLLS